ncbi:trypsin-like peptidase domain-containing protein [Rubinisphaera margarita]|uniref:trypsin-like peptidase domain-containing protein n=1 Tax=Rubinisphaera margarita TaxID=2909586 RepID=UPI001EE93B1E|nr:trypsin-like peptidase domain-containing protein [Rubinisphaera margarita]MCG6157343.1 thioredoxin domain-containing protein [Rubinisphaera margarita]
MKTVAQQIALAIVCLSATANLASAQQAVLYDFSASWCGPCQQMKPIVHKLEREGFPVQVVDIDQNPNLARQYNVSSIPAFVLVVNGKEVAREVGRTTEGQLRRMLASIPKPAATPSAPPQQMMANTATPQTPHNVVGRGNTGYEQPRLGSPSAFPGNQPPTTPAAPVSQPTAPASPQQYPANPEPFPAETILASNSTAADADAPVIRAQFDERENVTKPTPHIDSRAANVRIRIRDEKGINYGSGTVIDSRPGNTFVLTCGHIFRNVTDSSKIDIDIFVDDRFESFVGTVVKYDLDADVGLISVPTDGALPVARLAQIPSKLSEGDSVISVGCSGGQNPTIESLSVTALNRYTGPDNIECTGVPVQGRSGGGLFNEDNEVVGVCIAADPKEKRGLYAGLQPVVELLEGCGLAHTIRRQTPTGDSQILVQTDASVPAMAEAAAPQAPGPFDAAGDAPVAITPAATASLNPATLQALQAAQGAKLTIIIENPQNPGQPQVVVIPSATPRLLADLTGELNPSQTVVANSSPPATEFIPTEMVTPPQAYAAPTIKRELRIEDRSETMPTDFSAAQPYRRVRQ